MIGGLAETPKHFLGVRNSIAGQEWRERLDLRGRNAALAMAQAHAVPELVARVLAGRGVAADAALAFLKPSIRELMPDPSSLTGMDDAVDRLFMAVMRKQQVAIFGDYDVDGACASALLFKFLKLHGVESRIRIPDRIFEGYGPNPDAMRELAGQGAKLIVTVDCGSTSFEAIAAAADAGVDVVVLDHHQTGETLPACAALVNPNRQDDLSGLGYLCATGVVFMTLVALQRRLRDVGVAPAMDLLRHTDLVALATVCDVVPLTGLNRPFVLRGLEVMHARANKGLAALADIAKLSGPAEAWHLGFLFGPRINAGGRIGDAALGARLLVTEDPAEAGVIAAELDRLNRERQTHEARMVEEAMAQADAEIGSGEGPPVLVTESASWHPGIVGLIASRLKERFRRPAFAIHFGGNGLGSGSGRSVPGLDIGALVRGAVEAGILVKGGGHAMAAGLTVERARLADLRTYFETGFRKAGADLSETRILRLDGALTARGATIELIAALERAGPYGAGNPQPTFAFPAHQLRQPRLVGRDHVAVNLVAGDGASLSAIAFKAAGTPLGELLLAARSPTHVAGTLSADSWRGAKHAMLRVLDAAPVG
jgi:single-stranded-DNA-specific exonuclease